MTSNTRPTSGFWRATAHRGVQRGIDTAAELSGVLADKLHAAADPRAKQLRKRRWALRLGLFFVFSTGFWVLVTALLAAWSTPAWALFIPAPIAAGAAFLATLCLLRYRWLRAEPLPPERLRGSRRLPPWNSAARRPMAALADAQRGLHSLLGVIERSAMLPPDEIRELRQAAEYSAATMAATAGEVVSMERAASASPQARTHLTPTIAAFTAQMDRGVRQYQEMVTAAAQLVSAANSGAGSRSPLSARRHREELVGATDRLYGWAQAFDELGRLRGA